jgi:DNA-binding NarL/FixJ family response regulator
LQGYLIAQPMPVEAVAAWLAIWMHSGPATPAGETESPVPRLAWEKAAAPVPEAAESDAVQLSPRQLEVMQVLSEGCSVKEIARRLNISISTVKVHLSMAYSALGARNRIEAVMRVQPILRARSIVPPKD